jgi:hypothetical protein
MSVKDLSLTLYLQERLTYVNRSRFFSFMMYSLATILLNILYVA